MRLLAEERADALLHGGHTRHTAHHHHFVDLAGLQSRIGQGLFERSDRAVNKIGCELFEFGAREGHHQMFRTRRIGG